MTGPNLPTNRALSATAGEHLSDHNAAHQIVNLFDKDASPSDAQGLVYDSASQLYKPVGVVRDGELVSYAARNGVVGDGTTDDSAAVNTWLSAAAALGARTQLAAGSTINVVASTITIPSGTRLDGNGATIKNSRTGTSDRLVTLASVADVQISNLILDGDKASYATTTEQRHNLIMVNSQRVLVQNVTSKNAKGDGVYVGDDVTGYCTDITFIHVSGLTNHRNGLSITGASNFKQFGGSYSSNGGTSPMAGVDIEPNTDAVLWEKVEFHGVTFDSNGYDGVIVQAHSATPSVRQGGARFYGCSASNNGTSATSGLGNGVQIRWGNDVLWLGGVIRNNAYRGVYFRDTCQNLRFDTDVVANGQEGYGQPAGTITGLKIDGWIDGNGTSGAAGTYDGVNLAGSGVGLAFNARSGGAQQRYGLRTVSTWSYVSIGSGSHFPSNTTGLTSLGDDVGTRTQVASELAWRIGGSSGSNTAFAARLTGDTVDRFSFRLDGRMQWGAGGSSAIDTTLERTAAGTVGVGAGHAIRTGRAATASRPSAATVGSGAMFYDTTLSKPIWSDGTNWKDATGTTV